ncbi:hypothetical protein FJZ31_39650 [Candidatus Poribacteria bacterium]|nr:hypothetical protein [Candidatus Poribacteria bacterium]
MEQKKSKYLPHTRPPVVKPGSYSDYLSKHPEVVEEGLRKMGLDPDEIDKLLLEGWTVEIHLNDFKNATIKKIKKNT